MQACFRYPAPRLWEVPRLREICLATLSGFALYGGIAPSVAAQSAVAGVTASPQFAFDLPAEPLAETLDAIGRVSGRAIEFNRAAIAGRWALAIKGNMTARQAVEAVVGPEGFDVSAAASGAIKVAVVDHLDQIVVYARRDQAELGFKADRSDTATRSGSDLLDVPGSLTVITSKVLETQQVLTVRDALRNVSGIGFTDSPQGTPAFSVRGFSQSSLTTNGVPDRNAVQANVFGVERIEVLKGPQAILAGGDSLGGGVNVVTKKPSADPVRELILQYGSDEDKTVAGDLSGAISDDKLLTFRVIASAARAGRTDVGYDGRREDSVLPQLRWKDATTDFIVGASYVEQHLAVPEYTFARRDGAILPTPRMMLIHEKDGFDVRQRRAFYQLEQQIVPGIAFISRLQRTSDRLDLHLYSPGGLRYNAGAPNDQTNGTSLFFPSHSTTDQEQTSGDHYVRAELETGPIEHKLSVGAGHNNYSFEQRGYSGGSMLTVSLYPAVPIDFPEVHAVSTNLQFISKFTQHQKGVFLQDLLSWRNWSLLLNLRRTQYSQYGHADFIAANFSFDTPKTTVYATTPGAGVVYKVNPDTSLYASYSEGFVPQTTAACGGGLVPPIASRNKELGAKFQFLDDSLLVTTAAFQVDQSGTIVFDNLNNCANVRPAQRTRGMEVDVQGELARGWSAIFNYTYSTHEDVRDSTRLFPGKPRHKASLWTVYSLPYETVRGLGVGLGVSATGKMEGTFDTRFPFQVKDQAQVDVSVFYEQPKWGLTLGAKNVADSRLYGISSSNAYVPVLPGRSYMLTLRSSFN